jgi:hypothetical protein
MRFVTLAAPAIALFASASSSAGPLAPTRASDLVVAITKSSTACPVSGTLFDTRVLPDGTEEPFVIPPKRVLVVTSVDVALDTSAPAGQAGAPVVAIQTATTTLPILQGTVLTDVDGTAVGNVATTGAAVRPGVSICLVGGNTQGGVLHGFFAKDK